MKQILFKMLPFLLLGACQPVDPILEYGRHYQNHQDTYSLEQVVKLFPLGGDTAFLQKVLGEPIDMGFDYRYLVDSTSSQGCAVGAVFHIDDQGKIDDKWLDQICE